MKTYHIPFTKRPTGSYTAEVGKIELTYEKDKIKKLLIRHKKGGFIIKLKTQTASGFIRIPMRNYNLGEAWFAQFPSKEDIILFQITDEKRASISKVFINQWRYRFILLNIIS